MATTSLLDIKEALVSALAERLSGKRNPLLPIEGSAVPKISDLLDKESVNNLPPAMVKQMGTQASIEELAKSFEQAIAIVDDWATRAAVVIAAHRPNYGGGSIRLPHLSCDAPPLGIFESRLIEYLSAVSKDPIAAGADKALVVQALTDFKAKLPPKGREELADVINALPQML